MIHLLELNFSSCQDLGEIPEETEVAILETMLRIRKKDPAIYQPDFYFFGKGDEEEGSEEKVKGESVSKKAKPLYLKDVLARQV
jgi:hypothetical protein